MQSAHPVIADAFQRFGSYEQHPEKRFWLTGGFYFGTTFGTRERAESWVRRARQGHRGIAGADIAGAEVSIAHPEILCFSHCCVLYSTIKAWEAYGPMPKPLSQEDKDRFCEEQAWAVVALGARDVPTRYEDVVSRLEMFASALVAGHQGRAALESVRSGRGLPFHARAVYQMIVNAAVPLIPDEHANLWPLTPIPGQRVAGRAFTESVRNVLPELSCVTAAKHRIEQIPTSPPQRQPIARPFFLSTNAVSLGKAVIERVGTDAAGVQAKQALKAWWGKAGKGKGQEVSQVVFHRLVDIGAVLPTGDVTELGAYAAAALALENLSLEAAARIAMSSSRPAEPILAAP